MRKISLKALRFDNHTIEFRDGVNYIIGVNNSGKTTIFNLIQHLLGLRKDLGFFGSFIKEDHVALDLLINNIPYTFERNLFDKGIIISRGETQFTFAVGSVDISVFLQQILQPQYSFEIDQKLMLSILKNSFISEDNDLFALTTTQQESKLLLLGINTFYPKKIKTYVRELELQLKQQDQTIDSINSYRKDISFLLNRELSNANIDEILNGSFQKYKDQANSLHSLYDESRELLSSINSENESIFQMKMAHFEPIFSTYSKSFGMDNRISINDLFEGNLRVSSSGEISLLRLIFEMILQSQTQLTNGMGLLVNDAGLLHLDSHKTGQFRQFINKIVSDFDLQYIEFSNSITGLEKNEIVFDTTKNLRYA